MIVRFKSTISNAVSIKAAIKSSGMLQRRINEDMERRLRRTRRNKNGFDRQEFMSFKSLLFTNLNALKSGPLLRPLVEEYKIQFTTIKLSQDQSAAQIFWKCAGKEDEVGPQLTDIVKDLEIDLKATERLGSNLPKITFHPDPVMKNEKFLESLQNIPIIQDDEPSDEPVRQQEKLLKTNILSFEREQVLEKVHHFVC